MSSRAHEERILIDLVGRCEVTLADLLEGQHRSAARYLDDGKVVLRVLCWLALAPVALFLMGAGLGSLVPLIPVAVALLIYHDLRASRRSTLAEIAAAAQLIERRGFLASFDGSSVEVTAQELLISSLERLRHGPSLAAPSLEVEDFEPPTEGTGTLPGEESPMDLSLTLVKMGERFRRHSIFNVGLIRDQRPGALAAGTRSDWEAQGRRLSPDATPIIILWPFRPVVYLYELEDTLPEHSRGDVVGAFAVDGQFKPAFLATLEKALTTQKKFAIRVRRQKLGSLHAGRAATQERLPLGEAGFPSHQLKTDTGKRVLARVPTWRVTLSSTMSPAEQFVTLCHELGHIFCGHLGGCNFQPERQEAGWPERLDMSHSEREFEAESVAWIIAKRAGLTTGSEAYLRQHLTHVDAAKIDHQIILNAANRIERLAGIRYELASSSRSRSRAGRTD
jgi:hypothetical protein